jgi:hypothetical protein
MNWKTTESQQVVAVEVVARVSVVGMQLVVVVAVVVAVHCIDYKTLSKTKVAIAVIMFGYFRDLYDQDNNDLST